MTIEKNLYMMRRIRAENAMGSMQKRSMALGNDKLSIDEINVEINAVRKARK